MSRRHATRKSTAGGRRRTIERRQIRTVKYMRHGA